MALRGGKIHCRHDHVECGALIKTTLNRIKAKMLRLKYDLLFALSGCPDWKNCFVQRSQCHANRTSKHLALNETMEPARLARIEFLKPATLLL